MCIDGTSTTHLVYYHYSRYYFIDCDGTGDCGLQNREDVVAVTRLKKDQSPV